MPGKVQQKAIRGKLGQLKKVKDGVLSSQELATLIAERRVSWFKSNKDIILGKYKGLSDEEKACRIIFLDHMKINPEHFKIVKAGDKKIKIESYNFCPYLEACKKLGLDTRFVCKEIGEPSIQQICKLINPRLRFSRNYKNIRPHHDFCEEYFEIV